jgi:hypothetical protein
MLLSASIGEQTRMRIFWDEKGGRERYRNTLQKASNGSNAMKMAFKGEKGKLQ